VDRRSVAEQRVEPVEHVTGNRVLELLRLGVHRTNPFSAR